MGKLKKFVVWILPWVFPALCLLLAIGLPFGWGSVLLGAAAVLAMPLKLVRRFWDVCLSGISRSSTSDVYFCETERRRHTKAIVRFIVIAILFVSGCIIGFAAGREQNSIDAGETVSIAESLPEITGNGADAPMEATEVNTETEPEGKDSFSIRFIDVAQADSALVECDGHYMLIDGGNRSDSDKMYAILSRENVPKLDIIVGSHAHEDHIGGIPGALNYTQADIILCPVQQYESNAFGDFVKYAALAGNGITVPNVGETYCLGSAVITILGMNAGSSENDSSIILRIDYGETSFVFTGDAEAIAEQAVLENGADLSATVLKIAHHGSDTGTTEQFLRQVMPRYAVISVGAGNIYGHPAEDVLTRLRDAGVTVFRTDLQGDVLCVSDGRNVSFTVSRNREADVFAAPTEPEA